MLGKLVMLGKVELHAEQLGALGHPTCLAILRYVGEAGYEGAAAGAIQTHVDMPASTLSHHGDALLRHEGWARE